MSRSNHSAEFLEILSGVINVTFLTRRLLVLLLFLSFLASLL